MFGSESSTFGAQVSEFKTTLLKLYQLRTKLIAERESKRFRYITDMKAKTSSISSQVYNKLYSDRNDDAIELYRLIMSKFTSALPMINLNGQSIDGNGGSIYLIGGKYNVSFLSPIAHILNQPYDDSSSDPMYRVYGDHLLVMTPQEVMYQFIYSRMESYYDNVAHQPDFPPTLEWTAGLRGGEPVEGIEQYDYLMQVMNSFGAFEHLKFVYQTLEDIVKITQDIIRVQYEIDGVEASLVTFVTEYAERSGEAISATGILQEILNQAEGKIPVEQLPVGTIVASSGPASVAEENSLIVGEQAKVVTPIVAQKKSVLPWAAAAAVLFLLVKK